MQNSKTKIPFCRKYLISVAVTLAFILVTCSYAYSSKNGYTVSVDGEIIGTVAKKSDAYDMISDIESQLKNEYGNDIQLNQKIDISKAKVSEKSISPAKEMKSKLYYSLDFKVDAYSINANGKDIVFISDKNSAKKLLKELKSMYSSESEIIDETSIVENVKILPAKASVKKLMSYENAIKHILSGNEKARSYEVKSGDTAWSIASSHGIKLGDLESANPGADIERLQIGQILSLSVPQPYISVRTVQTQEYEEKIPFELKYEKSSSLYEGEKKVKQSGKEGAKKVKLRLTKINGLPSQNEIISEETVENPVDAIVLTGTKGRPKTLAYGVFSPPSRGSVTSGFGSRWGKKHKGIDISGPVGTPITASDSGKVVTAGWVNGYGKTVVIDHENGYKTLYAHANALNVKVGDRVYTGQAIATIGTTGKVTGPNLHFEVQKNNSAVDPLGYVEY